MLKRLIRASAILVFIPVATAVGGGTATTHAATCTPTGFVRDSINLTAAQINPTGTVHGDVNATGCNIGIYYGPASHGTVRFANIHGANYYGVVNNGGNVTITFSAVHDIGESPLNGTQHGVGIYFAFGSAATGTIAGNAIYRYQKGGIVVNGTGSSATVDHNVVAGLGPVNFIAQNGIQFGYGSTGSISHNSVSGNAYTGSSTASGGIILVGGACYFGSPTTNNVTVDHNQVSNNDIGVWFSNLDALCNPVSTSTNDVASHNEISSDAVTNGIPYQAGIADQGNQDVLDHNSISGAGYAQAPPTTFCIDDTSTNNVTESHNSCGSSDSGGGD